MLSVVNKMAEKDVEIDAKSFGIQRVWSLLSRVVSYERPESALASAETKILQAISCPCQKRLVDIGMDRSIWTLSFNPSSRNTPLVLLHGMGTGAALWALNFCALSADRPVYAIDILGFGRSSRTIFSNDPVLAEMEFVESIEAWRKRMSLEMFVLMGHCFGGFLGSSYAVRFPDRVRHLILVDPWGFRDRGQLGAYKHRVPMPLWVKTIGFLFEPFNPLAGLRLAGSWGPMIVKKLKHDLTRNYEQICSDDTISEYIYEWNALRPTGETAFKHMTCDFGWAIYPMINRMKEIAEQVAITNIFGSRSWVDSDIGQQIKRLRPKSYVETQIVSGAGHFVFADKSDLFNCIVNRTCLLVDHHLDLIHSRLRTPLSRRRSRSESAPDLRLKQPSHRSLARFRQKHNSVCLAEVDENDAEDDESREISPVLSPVFSSDKPVFNISYDDDE